MEENRTIPKDINKREFVKKYAGKSFYKKLRLIGIFGYVMFVVLFFASVWVPMTSFERLICLGLTLGIHLGKSRTCAYVLLGVGILQTVIPLILSTYGYFVGITELIISIGAILLFHKVYREYELLMGK